MIRKATLMLAAAVVGWLLGVRSTVQFAKRNPREVMARCHREMREGGR